jgi:hypothetical protein
MSSTVEKSNNTPPTQETALEGAVHVQPRDGHAAIDVPSDIVGYDHDRMKDRGLLTYEEEKKLLRRVDWRLMPLCALIFLVKNVDANNVSARNSPRIKMWRD